jgi:hypothetical protein
MFIRALQAVARASDSDRAKEAGPMREVNVEG